MAVLVAIAIPVFTKQLEKSRESTDAANIRDEYAQIMTEILDAPDTSISTGHSVTVKQTKAGWTNTEALDGLKALADSTDDVVVVKVDLGDGSDGPATSGTNKKVNITYTAPSGTTKGELAIAAGN